MSQRAAKGMRVGCALLSFAFFVATLGTAYSLFSSGNGWFPGPTPECGLHKVHGTYELRDDGDWIWIQLNKIGKKDAKKHTWKWSEECYNIARYDIVSDPWAPVCASWCDAHLHDFMYNEPCAFGLVNDTHGVRFNRRGMPVLKACQKAHVALLVPLSDTQCWNVALAVTLVAFFIGACKFALWGDTLLIDERTGQQLSLTYSSQEDSICLCCFPSTRAVAFGFEVWKLGISMFLDISTDFVSVLLFLAHGQPFYAAGMIMIMLQNVTTGGSDLLGTDRVCTWLLSLKLRYPAAELLKWKKLEATEARVGFLIMFMNILILPPQDVHGDAVLSMSGVITFVLSAAFNLYGIFEGAICDEKNHLIQEEGIHWNFDRQIELFEDRKRDFTLAGLQSFVVDTALIGTAAVVFTISRDIQQLEWFFKGMMAMAAVCVGLPVAFLVAWRTRDGQSALRWLVRAPHSARPILGAYVAFTWYRMASSGDLDKLPMHWRLPSGSDSAELTEAAQTLFLQLTRACAFASPLFIPTSLRQLRTAVGKSLGEKPDQAYDRLVVP